jgi:hypothetical protein
VATTHINFDNYSDPFSRSILLEILEKPNLYLPHDVVVLSIVGNALLLFPDYKKPSYSASRAIARALAVPFFLSAYKYLSESNYITRAVVEASIMVDVMCELRKDDKEECFLVENAEKGVEDLLSTYKKNEKRSFVFNSLRNIYGLTNQQILNISIYKTTIGIPEFTTWNVMINHYHALQLLAYSQEPGVKQEYWEMIGDELIGAIRDKQAYADIGFYMQTIFEKRSIFEKAYIEAEKRHSLI